MCAGELLGGGGGGGGGAISTNTMHSWYLAVTFTPITHSHSSPVKASYRCLSWVCEVLLSKLFYCVQYSVILYRDISRVIYSIRWNACERQYPCIGTNSTATYVVTNAPIYACSRSCVSKDYREKLKFGLCSLCSVPNCPLCEYVAALESRIIIW